MRVVAGHISLVFVTVAGCIWWSPAAAVTFGFVSAAGLALGARWLALAAEARAPEDEPPVDLSAEIFDRVLARFDLTRDDDEVLGGLFPTRNRAVEALARRAEALVKNTALPLLLAGETGTGKSALAQALHEVRQRARRRSGPFIAVNGATVRGDQGQSAVFGHVEGAFTGATRARKGLMVEAEGGTLLIDEVADLSMESQTMLLTAIETKRFRPVGGSAADEVTCDVWFIAATSQDLDELVRQGKFRADLRGRLRGALIRLPPLRERPEDLEPALDTELALLSQREARTFSLTDEARALWLFAAASPEAVWPENFRSHGYAVEALTARASPDGVIDRDGVEQELAELRIQWGELDDGLGKLVAAEKLRKLNRGERWVLADTVAACRRFATPTEASRFVYGTTDDPEPDTSRLRRYLEKFDLTFDRLHGR